MARVGRKRGSEGRSRQMGSVNGTLLECESPGWAGLEGGRAYSAVCPGLALLVGVVEGFVC